MTTHRGRHEPDSQVPGFAAIAAVQRDVADEVWRRAGYPISPGTQPGNHRTSASSEPAETPPSSASPVRSAHSSQGGNGPAAGSGPDTAPGAGETAQLLFTPTQAAAVLQVRESWLRRRAARHQVPCTFLGKHLRFSRTDLERIVADAARPATSPRPPRRPRDRGPANFR